MSTPGDFKKAIKTKIDKTDTTIDQAIRDAVKRGIPREVPLSFGYMRLSGTNPYLSEYRQMLQDAGISHLYDDTPAAPNERPQFEAMMAEARPNDMIVMVRLDHISTNEQIVAQTVLEICEQRLAIKLLQNATKGWPDTAAVVQNLWATISPKIMWKLCGGDGGGGNGGP